jgi:hypothetical protein
VNPAVPEDIAQFDLDVMSGMATPVADPNETIEKRFWNGEPVVEPPAQNPEGTSEPN